MFGLADRMTDTGCWLVTPCTSVVGRKGAGFRTTSESFFCWRQADRWQLYMWYVVTTYVRTRIFGQT